MRVLGVDFTSRPRPGKPICVAACDLDGDRLTFASLEALASLPAFEAWLERPGPWVAGFDLPFAQSRRFLGAIGWPLDWPAFADHLAGLSREAFRAALEDYKRDREPGDREHARAFEAGSGAVSPQKLYGVPVALMQFEAVPRIRRAKLHVPGLLVGDRSRVAVEAYPGVAARALIGRSSYKNDVRAKQTTGQAAARREILEALVGEPGRRRFDLRVEAPAWLADDPGADPLDALVCAVQAAWAWRAMGRDKAFLACVDPAEGWIADPDVMARLRALPAAGPVSTLM